VLERLRYKNVILSNVVTSSYTPDSSEWQIDFTNPLAWAEVCTYVLYVYIYMNLYLGISIYTGMCGKTHTNGLLISLTMKQRELSNSSLFDLSITSNASSQTKWDRVFVLSNLIGHQDDRAIYIRGE